MGETESCSGGQRHVQEIFNQFSVGAWAVLPPLVVWPQVTVVESAGYMVRLLAASKRTYPNIYFSGGLLQLPLSPQQATADPCLSRFPC